MVQIEFQMDLCLSKKWKEDEKKQCVSENILTESVKRMNWMSETMHCLCDEAQYH